MEIYFKHTILLTSDFLACWAQKRIWLSLFEMSVFWLPKVQLQISNWLTPRPKWITDKSQPLGAFSKLFVRIIIKVESFLPPGHQEIQSIKWLKKHETFFRHWTFYPPLTEKITKQTDVWLERDLIHILIFRWRVDWSLYKQFSSALLYVRWSLKDFHFFLIFDKEVHKEQLRKNKHEYLRFFVIRNLLTR